MVTEAASINGISDQKMINFCYYGKHLITYFCYGSYIGGCVLMPSMSDKLYWSVCPYAFYVRQVILVGVSLCLLCHTSLETHVTHIILVEQTRIFNCTICAKFSLQEQAMVHMHIRHV